MTIKQDTTANQTVKQIEILLVEDNEGDIGLVEEVFQEAKIMNNLNIAEDGEEAMLFLHRKGKFSNVPSPDIILLDLNLSGKDGREVLKEIKEDNELKRIPVVILTTSKAEEDILKSYNLHANSYITKPVDFDQFIRVIKSIENFWLDIVKLPSKGNGSFM
ncbi:MULTISPECIES: response regulator [Methanobacterium]|uniref:Response regulator n=1 Tax=Methanobacterium veterum TaxID=408577 RepID=A0A9E5DJM2_9EURY|nr:MULTISPECIES: response regulator [Methanobacterium]MCZ3364709.1 response regulator [Methanobacterium veterum]MCZ3372463.1 response regulator [Methanobacterium veterum]